MRCTYRSSVFCCGSPRNDAGPVAETTAPILIGLSAAIEMAGSSTAPAAIAARTARRAKGFVMTSSFSWSCVKWWATPAPRSGCRDELAQHAVELLDLLDLRVVRADRKSTRLNSSH